jgi:hypothetical protein
MYNAQLYEIIKRQPKARADFSAIKGMKNKADKYGEQIIKLLQEYERLVKYHGLYDLSSRPV